MILEHVQIYCPDHHFRSGRIRIRNDRIEELSLTEDMAGTAVEDEEILDGGGALAIPGMIDLHFPGCLGKDICDGSADALDVLSAFEASIGVTAIAPAMMTLGKEDLLRTLKRAAAFAGAQKRAAAENQMETAYSRQAALIGINMEGPFISPVKKGAQDERFILPCDAGLAAEFLRISKGLVKIIGLAPEEDGGKGRDTVLQYIREMKEKVHISLAHTNADYDTAKAAIDAGADHAVHLFNAMPAFHHRDPGVVGAVADSPQVMAELITDGIHVHPAMVRSAFRLLGAERIVLISDSVCGTGMPDGEYNLGGNSFRKAGRRCTMVRDGAIAGSVTPLPDGLRTAVLEMGIPLEDAILCATENPAKVLGVFGERGSLEAGKIADLVLLDPEDLALRQVILRGQPI